MNAIARPRVRLEGVVIFCCACALTKLANEMQKTGGTSIKIIS